MNFYCAIFRLHIWDLSAGDIYPVISVDKERLIEGRLSHFNIAKPTDEDDQTLFAVSRLLLVRFLKVLYKIWSI